MKIALLSWESVYSVYVGGVAAHVSELASAMVHKGHEVHIFTRAGAQGQIPYECIGGVHYHRCTYDSHSHFVEEVNNMCRAFVDAVFDNEDTYGNFDIIHAHDWLAANAMIWIKEGRNRKTVMTMHSTEYGRCGNNFGSEEVSHIEWNGIYHANKVIAVSNNLKNEVNRLYSLPDWKVSVIYNGVDCNRYNGWIDPATVKKMYNVGAMDPMVLFAGRMVTQKGPDMLLEAIPKILRKNPKTKFIYAGDGGMRPELEHVAHRMGIDSSIRFLGHLGGWKLMDLFKASDCVCVPSRNEPFGIVILEAWSAGKPVIGSINGGPSEIIWHDVNGLKIQADPDSVEWGVDSMFADFDHARWMGKNGRMAVETVFSWNAIADETLSLYSS